MASVPSDLIWEIVKRNNAFLVKEFGNGTAMVQFSKEKNNLYNVNSFKHSGLANKKTVSIQPGGKDLSVVLATTKTKQQTKPANLYHRSVMKKEFGKMAKAVVNQSGDNKTLPAFSELLDPSDMMVLIACKSSNVTAAKRTTGEQIL